MRIVLLISIVLNVALAAAFLGWFVPFKKGKNSQYVRPVNTALVNSNNLRIVKTNVLVRPKWFSWQEIESADYQTYIQNLRAIGMPEPTIRDLIIADVDQVLARKRRELNAQNDIEWWRAQPSAEYQSNALARAFALEEERSALLTRLLGENWRRDRIDQQPEPLPLTGPVLGALPDDTKKTVQDISARSSERMREYLAAKQAAGQQPSAAEMARLRDETRQQLAQVLNPQQLEEFLLRNSYNASQLRTELQGLSLSPDDFRRVFRSVDALDRDIQLRLGSSDAESQRQLAVLQQQRAEAIRAAIGPDRYDGYVMLHDPTYQEMLAAAQKAGGNEETATALYDIQRATTDEIARIRSDNTLTEGQKQEQIREVQLDDQRARALVLGEPEPAAPPAAQQAANVPQLRSHTKIPGETLGEIALRYGIGISAIRAANPGVDINRLPPGAVINVPNANPMPPLPMPPNLRR